MDYSKDEDKQLPRVGHLTGLLQSSHFLCSYGRLPNTGDNEEMSLKVVYRVKIYVYSKHGCTLKPQFY